jgi:hypothetical protein
MRRLGTALGAIAITTTALIVGASPAAAVTCSGYGCDGKSPSGSGCSSASQIINDVPLGYSDNVGGTAYDGHVRLYYSSLCRTVWAYVYGLSSDSTATAHVYRNSDGHQQGCSAGNSSCTTNMLYDANVTSYATGDNYAFDPFDGYWVTYYGRTANF